MVLIEQVAEAAGHRPNVITVTMRNRQDRTSGQRGSFGSHGAHFGTRWRLREENGASMEHNHGFCSTDRARRSPGTGRHDPNSHKRLKRRKNTRLSPRGPRGCLNRGIEQWAPGATSSGGTTTGGTTTGGAKTVGRQPAGPRPAGPRPAGPRPADHDRRGEGSGAPTGGTTTGRRRPADDDRAGSIVGQTDQGNGVAPESPGSVRYDRVCGL